MRRAVLPILALFPLVMTSAVDARSNDWPAPLPIAPDSEAGPLPPSVSAEPVSNGHWRCTFRFHASADARTVALAGVFNGWSKAATPLTGPDAEGTWSTSVTLDAGRHLYKFVINDSLWLPDPANPQTVHDGHGGRNSVLRLGYVAHLDRSNAQVSDGQIEARALTHDPDRPLYFQRLGGDRALFRLHTLKHDVNAVRLTLAGGDAPRMAVVVEDERFALWETTARLPEGRGGTVYYTFLFADGLLRGRSPQTYEVLVTKKDVFHTPEWAKHAVWYQVMVDRFRNGDPSNDRQPVRPWTSEWFTPSPWEGKDGQTFYEHFVFDRQYGGDLAGLEEKLPYLKDLGINAIYLNPVFKAESHHKYNAETYLHIDDHFAVKGDYEKISDKEDHTAPSTWVWTESDKRFLAFLKEAHDMGLKVIIDGVFNHVGTAHPAFQDVKENREKSRYADWFDVRSWDPFEYEGWFGHPALPVFKKSPDGLASETVKQYIFNVTRRWMDPDGDGDPSDGIDGWRLDVPNEVPAPFWVEWRQVVKSINPDAYITGEIWDQADQWLDGRHFDAVMNYEFSKVAVAWIFDKKWKITPSEADRRFRELRLAYPLEATLVLQNLMNSHDTDRVASMAHNPDRAYDHGNRIQDNGPKYDNTKPKPRAYQKVRLAALLQMTYVGAPMVYYGDEVGMWGADDPTCRKPMLWKDLEPYDVPQDNFVMEDHRAYYQRVIALRNAHPALRTGTFRTLLTDDDQDVWAFLRTNHDEQLIVALNASNRDAEAVIPLPPDAPTNWVGVYGHDGRARVEDDKLRILVPAINGIVVHAATPT